MNLSAQELRLVVAELQQLLIGAVVQKVQQPRPTAIVVTLRAPGQTQRLLIETASQAGRLHLTSRTLENPQSPPAFCRKLRKELLGARLVGLEQLPDERVVLLGFARAQGSVAFSLVVELTAHHANLFLLNAEGTILSAMRQSQSHKRALNVGNPYQAPAPSDPIADAQSRFPYSGVSAAIDAVYADAEALTTRDRVVIALGRQLRQAKKRFARTVGRVQADYERAVAAESYRQDGELIKSNLHRLRRGMAEVQVTDYHQPDCPQRLLRLDPLLSPQENMARCFKQYRRFRGALEQIESRLTRLRADPAFVDQCLLALEPLTDPDAVAALWRQAAQRGVIAVQPSGSAAVTSSNRRSVAQREPVRRFTSRDGFTILVGKGARENHTLTFQLARGNDWWLHARDWAGSHVVVRCPKRSELPSETLLDAATLAAHYSKGKADTLIEVHYCRANLVRRVPNAPPGRVFVAQAKCVAISIEAARLQRLLSDEPQTE